MPENTEIHGDQKNITVFGISGPWLVALVAVILAGVVGLVFVLVTQLRSDESNNEPVVLVFPTSTPTPVPTDTPETTATAAAAAVVPVQPTALPTPIPTPTPVPTGTAVPAVLPAPGAPTPVPTGTAVPAVLPAPGAATPVPTATEIPVPDIEIIVPQTPLEFTAGERMPITGVRVVTRDQSSDYEVRIDWGDGSDPELPNGSNPTRLTSNPGPDYAPSWSRIILLR